MIEHELKIPVAELAPVRLRLEEAGARRLHPRLREANTLLDDADRSLATAESVLRVRRVGDRSVLTFKGPASYRGAVKGRREIELEVTSSELVLELLSALGYTPGMRYEKERESWTLGSVRVDLDRTPMGDFVELEGPPHDLEAAAATVGLDPKSAVPGSYPSLWQEHRRRHPELDLGPDMVFDP